MLAACKSRQTRQENSVAPTSNVIARNTTPIDTIQKLADSFIGDSAYLKVGEKYILVYSAIEDSMANVESADADFGPRCPSVNKDEECETDEFQGCDRAKPKTTMLSVSTTSFATVKELITNLNALSPDTEMQAKNISGAENSTREPEERRNVLIQRAYLYTIYREPDNDFHIIIGSSPQFEQSVFLNVEVSGTPRGASTATKNRFMRVRNKFKDHPNFGTIRCSTRQLKTPFLLTNLKGSLFFDSHHPGGVGRGRAKPKTAWEIHPIIDLTIAGIQ